MEEILTIKKLVNEDNFDPMNIDISEFEELSKSMPKDAGFDLYTAETLAVQFLRAADRCSGILMMLTNYENKMQSNRNSIRGRLFLKAKDEGYKTVEERKAYVDCHDDLINAENILASAHTARKYFEMRHDYFLKSHQYMKERVRGEQKQLQSSGFSETSGNESKKIYGEQDW